MGFVMVVMVMVVVLLHGVVSLRELSAKVHRSTVILGALFAEHEHQFGQEPIPSLAPPQVACRRACHRSRHFMGVALLLPVRVVFATVMVMRRLVRLQRRVMASAFSIVGWQQSEVRLDEQFSDVP